MKLYDMIQVYSSGSTVIMHLHYIWPVLHMCYDIKNDKKHISVGKSWLTIVEMCGGGWNLKD